ncbi:reverse transcriptase domain-containing protein [Tanacetum coccineum]
MRLRYLRRERTCLRARGYGDSQALARSEVTADIRGREFQCLRLRASPSVDRSGLRGSCVQGISCVPRPWGWSCALTHWGHCVAVLDFGVFDCILTMQSPHHEAIQEWHLIAILSGTGCQGSERVARASTYQDFMKCKPLYFKGTEGVVELTQWFERMETVFRISNCSVENQIKFSTCTLLAGALTWWNSHVMTVTHDIAYSMTWVDLRKKMTDKYCPRNEMKKLEAELWNLKVIGTDVVKYNQRFQELALLCVRMFPEESDKIERYVGGLPDMIHGNIVASRPKTMQEAIEMATELMDKRVSTIAERQAENKRKFESTSRNNQNQQQQQDKRQNTGRAYTAGSGDKKQYGGSRPLCSKCNYHHDGPCAPKCYKCNKYGHIARDCRGTGNANNINNQKGTGSGQKPTCFECGAQGHFKKECPRMKNNKGNRGNQAGNDRAPAKVYVVGNAGANPDNVVAGVFPLSGNITAKEIEDMSGRSDRARLFVPIVQDFPEVHQSLHYLEGAMILHRKLRPSKKGLGAVLMQREKVISYASRQLKIHEKNYAYSLIELWLQWCFALKI